MFLSSEGLEMGTGESDESLKGKERDLLKVSESYFFFLPIKPFESCVPVVQVDS